MSISSRTGLPAIALSLGLLAATIGGWASFLETEAPTSRTIEVATSTSETAIDFGEISTFPALTTVQVKSATGEELPTIELCQFTEPPCPTCDNAVCYGPSQVRCGVDCQAHCGCDPKWRDWQPIPWQVFDHGEYVGPARTSHVPEYRLRVDDQMEFIYRLTHTESAEPYRLNVGDQIRVESLTDEKLDRELVIQPDGSITLRLLGQVRAARMTVDELRKDLEERYKKYYKTPSITVTPLQVNTKLEGLRATVDSRFGSGGQTRTARVAPDGTVQLPAIGSVPAQGLTMDEVKLEIDARYAEIVSGIEVTPVLTQRAPRHVFVLGEVRQPGRYTLEGPTTVMQAIALAGGWNFGGDLRHVVVFRRAEDWRLVATKLDIRDALLGKKPCPADEIFVRDSDLVMLPKSSLLLATDFIDLIFVRGIYGVMPNQGMSISFTGDSVF